MIDLISVFPSTLNVMSFMLGVFKVKMCFSYSSSFRLSLAASCYFSNMKWAAPG